MVGRDVVGSSGGTSEPPPRSLAKLRPRRLVLVRAILRFAWSHAAVVHPPVDAISRVFEGAGEMMKFETMTKKPLQAGGLGVVWAHRKIEEENHIYRSR